MAFVNCSQCNKELKRKPFLIKTRKYHFCSRICKSKYQENSIPWNKGRIGIQPSTRKGVSFEQQYGKKRALEMRQNLSNKLKGHIQSEEAILKALQTRKTNGSGIGEKNSMYRNGITHMEKKLKKEIKNCEKCNIPFWMLKSSRYINVHHIDKNRENNKRENLQVLCAMCHMKIHQQIGDRRGRYSVKK